jgi:hypothetical protein
MAEIDNLGEGAENLGDSIGNLKDVLSELAVQLNKSAALTNDLAQNLQDAAGAGEDLKDSTEDASKAQEKQKKTLDEVIKGSRTLTSLVNIGKGAALAFATQLGKADQETASLGRNLALSRSEAVALRKEFGQVALNSGDININSRELIKANNTLNAQLGTAVKFNNDSLKAVTKLTRNIGISAESAANLAFAAEGVGKPLEEVRKDVLEVSFGLQQSAGVSLDLNKILEKVGKVSGNLRANLGNNPKAIAAAITQAKLLGTELEKLSAAGKTLLDFESSIEKELEAELLTGKQLNLEKARSAALAGDEVALGAELAKNIGTQAEFLDMNVLQREKLAAAVGLEADEVANMLFNQEAMGRNAQELRDAGREDLAQRQEQLDTQKKIAMAQENFQAAMADLSMVALPIVEYFGAFVQALSESKTITAGLVGLLAGLAIAQKSLAMFSIIASTAKIFGGNAALGPIGIGIALAGVASMMAAIAAVNLAEGGIVEPRAGGTIARIGEAGQAEAVVPLSKAKQMGFGGGGSSQPIVIQNNWDAFQASNGNGRRGLGGTQSLQASPTFA